MKTPEIRLDEVPAPGEPLTEAIHEDNQKLLKEELEHRAALANSKLDKKTFRALTRRHRALQKRLIAGNWNQLVTQRFKLEQALERLKYEAKQQPIGPEWKRTHIRIGRVLIQLKQLKPKIDKFQSAADEFESITNRFKAHEQVVAWEIEDAENRAEFEREAFVWEAQIKAVMRQSARMHHAGTDSKGNHFCDIPIIERIIFKDDRVLYQIRTTYQGWIDRFFNRWHSALPYDVDISDLTCDETLENLSAGCNRTVTVERSKMGKNLFYVISRLDAPDGIPKRQLYQTVIDFYPLKDHAKTPWAMGTSENRKVLWSDFETFPHILLAGSTQGGKSNHLNQMIATFATMHAPSELGLQLIDLKGGIEFVHWKDLKHQIRPMAKTPGEVLEALQFMQTLMKKRLVKFMQLKAKNLESYNLKASVKLPRLITIVDEMATLIGLGPLTDAIHHELRILSAQGRAVGIHLVLCTQHSSVEIVPGPIKTNMSVRAATSMPTYVASQIVLGTDTAAKIPKIPGRIVFSMGRDEIIVQSPFISDAEIARAVEISQSYPNADLSEFVEDAKAPVVPAREKFTKEELFQIVLTEHSGKISASNIFDYLGGKQNDVITLRQLRAMVNEIIEIGIEKGIEFQGMRYRLEKIPGRGNYAMVPAFPIEHISEPKNEGDTEEFKALARSDVETTLEPS